jgi:hypothetical protein
MYCKRNAKRENAINQKKYQKKNEGMTFQLMIEKS